MAVLELEIFLEGKTCRRIFCITNISAHLYMYTYVTNLSPPGEILDLRYTVQYDRRDH